MTLVVTPPLAYIIEAMRISARMRATGVVLTRDQAHELALASLGPERQWQAQAPILTPQGRVVLDRIVAERAATDPDTRPEAGTTDTSDIRDQSAASGGERGRAGTAARQQQENAGEIDPITRYLRDVPDPDDGAWTPT